MLVIQEEVVELQSRKRPSKREPHTSSQQLLTEIPHPQATNRTNQEAVAHSIYTRDARPFTRAPLTKRNLEEFELMGKRDSGGGSGTSRASGNTTTTDREFGSQLLLNNIIGPRVVPQIPPDDLDAITASLNIERASEILQRDDFDGYCMDNSDATTELTISHVSYMRLAKPVANDRKLSNYRATYNSIWSEYKPACATGLSDARPDIMESFRKTTYPSEALDYLMGALAPTTFNLGMPAYAVEVKGTDGTIESAQEQCKYDGALMTEGAYRIHKYMGKPDEDFFGKTQAITIAFKGIAVFIYGHFALKILGPSEATTISGEPTGTAALANTAATRIQYRQYRITTDNPCDSLEEFQIASRHIRNAQDIAYNISKRRKDDLWQFDSACGLRQAAACGPLTPPDFDPRPWKKHQATPPDSANPSGGTTEPKNPVGRTKKTQSQVQAKAKPKAKPKSRPKARPQARPKKRAPKPRKAQAAKVG